MRSRQDFIYKKKQSLNKGEKERLGKGVDNFQNTQEEQKNTKPITHQGDKSEKALGNWGDGRGKTPINSTCFLGGTEGTDKQEKNGDSS